MTDLDLNGTLFDSIATAKDAAAALRKERAKANELAAQMQDRSVAMARELRALADELDPPTEPAEPLAVKLDRAIADAVKVGAQQAEDLDRWASPEPVLTQPEYDTALKDGRLTLRPTGRSWPAACEMCGAGNGQPCQAVSE